MFDRLLPDEKAALAAYFANGGKVKRPAPAKVAKVEPRDPRAPVVISRVAARPLAMKMTQGFAFVALSDRNSRR